MDTKGQLTYFLLSVAVGFVGGLLYEIFVVFRILFSCDKGKRKGIGIGLDVAFCLCFTIWCIYVSFCLRFPDFRGYVCWGWVLGGIIYLIFLHRILAILENVCYNVLVRMAKKAKSKKKTLKKERKDI